MIRNFNTREDCHTITAALVFENTNAAFEWYRKILGAEVHMRLMGPDNKIRYAELCIGDSMIFITEDNPLNENLPSRLQNNKSIHLHVYVEDVDSVIYHALENGAIVVEPASEGPGYLRSGSITDPFGYTWTLVSGMNVRKLKMYL